MSPIRILLVWAALCLLLAAEAVAAASSPSGWQAVLVAGDNAQPVFDNAVAAVRDWLAAGGVPARNIHVLSATQPKADPGARRGGRTGLGRAGPGAGRGAASGSGRRLSCLRHLARPARRGNLARLWRRVPASRRAGASLVRRLRPRADRGRRVGLLHRRVYRDAGAEPDRRHRRPRRPALVRLRGRADLRRFRRVPAGFTAARSDLAGGGRRDAKLRARSARASCRPRPRNRRRPSARRCAICGSAERAAGPGASGRETAGPEDGAEPGRFPSGLRPPAAAFPSACGTGRPFFRASRCRTRCARS